MLSSRFFALAFFSIVSSSTAIAQAPVAGQSASPPQASATPSATDTSKPYIAVAAAESAEAAAESATAAPAVGESLSAAAPAKPAVVRDPAPTLTVNIDLAQQQMVVSENGAALYSWPISAGLAKFPTPRGRPQPDWPLKRPWPWAPPIWSGSSSKNDARSDYKEYHGGTANFGRQTGAARNGSADDSGWRLMNGELFVSSFFIIGKSLSPVSAVASYKP